jgi:hypothetical protein
MCAGQGRFLRQRRGLESILVSLAAAGATLAREPARGLDAGMPHLRRTGSATQLLVGGEPLVMPCGELRNSSPSSLSYLLPLWSKPVVLNLNTVIVGLSWERAEPEEGKFDFSPADGIIEAARLYDKSSTSARVRLVNCSFRNPWISAQAEDDTLRVPILFELRRTERTTGPGGVDSLSCYVHDAAARPALGFEEGKRDLPLRDVHGQILVTGPGTPSAKFGSKAQSVDLTVTRAAQ